MFAESPWTENSGAVSLAFPGIVGAGLSTGLQAVFDQHSSKFKKHRTLLLEGDECQTVFCLADGWLVLSKALEDGQNQIIDFVLPGDIVDPVSADGETSSVTVDALTDGELAAIPYRKWESMTGEWPELHHLAHLLDAAKQARRAERMLRLGKGTAEMRVAYALVEFCIRIDCACDSDLPMFHIPLTQQQLGDYVGLSSVHVCRTMRRMSRNEIIEMRDHMDIRVLDPRSLAQMAGVDIDALKREILPG